MALLVLVISMFCAVVPMLGFLALMWWLDRHEREPLWLVGLAYLWGATGAVVLSLVGSWLLSAVFGVVLGAEATEALSAVLVAPAIEEPAKALLLVGLVWSRHFDNTTDGFVYGAAIGLGFGMSENFLYFVNVGSQGDLASWAVTIVIRTLYSALMHAGATSMIGAALGFAKFNGWIARIVGLPVAFGLAWGMHALWNGLLTADALAGLGGLLSLVNLLVFPLEFGVLVLVLQVCLWDERRTIRRELLEEVQGGLIPATHLPRIASWLGRWRSDWVPRGVNKHAYLRAATTLAFRKHQARRSPGQRFYAEEITRLRSEIGRLLRGV